MNKLKGKIFSGIFWNSLQTIVNRSFGFIIKMVLARLLFPEDFGIVGMAVVFTSFVQVFNDLGFGSALIQRDSKIIPDDYFQTAFWTGVTWSILVYAFVSLFIAPFAAEFYGEDILQWIIPVLSLGILASPINLVHRAQLTREMNFKKLAIINNSSSIFSGILSLLLAFLGFGVWSLVFNTVAQFIIAMPQYFLATGWKPQFVWKRECFKDMFGFGVFTTLSGLVSKFASQGDYLIIGKYLGKFDLGIYSFAFIIADSLRAQITSILNSVLYPLYSKLQNNSLQQFHVYGQSIFYNALIITPIMTILFFLPEIIVYIFGEKWISSIPILQIIAIAAVIQVMTASFPSLLRANNKTQVEFKLQLVKVLVFYIPLVFIGVIYYGLIGVAFAVLISRILGVILNLVITNQLLNLSPFFILRNFLSGILPSIISLIISSTILMFISVQNLIVLLIIKFLLLVIFIILFSYILYGKEFKKLLKLYQKW